MATEILTTKEGERLIELEHVVHLGLKNFVEVGTALMEIRDNRLYRSQHKTFDDYLSARWGIKKSRASQLINTAESVRGMSTMVDKPDSERQARPLSQLPEEDRGDAWEEAIEVAAPKPPTGKQVQAVVDQKLGKPPKAPKKAAADPPTIPPTIPPAVAQANGKSAAEAAERAKARLPEHVKIDIQECDEPETVDDVIEENQERKAIEEESTTDTEWIEGLPLHKVLKGMALKIFMADALNWRTLAKERARWGKAISEQMNRTRGRSGPWLNRMASACGTPGPDKWIRCAGIKVEEGAGCGGLGTVNGLTCPRCKGAGYWTGR